MGQVDLEEAHAELADIYPTDSNGAVPITYLWARTIQCEGPGCGAEIALVRSFLLGKRGRNLTGLRLEISAATKSLKYTLVSSEKVDSFTKGTLRRGSATCPVCGYTVPGAKVRQQAADKEGGADTAWSVSRLL